MTLPELDDSVRPVFVDFMTRVARFDELANMGNQLLSSFQQELVGPQDFPK
ncbi:hypothetical protein AMTR_s00033p00030080 [Amborella trichopoda]|uniref:DUF7795 domain-containing protein n=1 Tax=Amborella trichopoda TaxID=13333 RepID=U5CVN9_AMBTC|nr:hypothetical protein AMTR_s00033p00030080 [Amborella trichopoda]